MKAKVAIAMLCCQLVLSGCASRQLNRDLDAKIDREPSVPSPKDLHNEATYLIATAPGLTTEQRSDLSELRDSLRMELDRLGQESRGLRSVLLKDLVSANYNPDEVDLIKKRLRKIEEKKISLIFNAVERTEKLLGKQSARDPGLFNEFLFSDFPRGPIMR